MTYINDNSEEPTTEISRTSQGLIDHTRKHYNTLETLYSQLLSLTVFDNHPVAVRPIFMNNNDMSNRSRHQSLSRNFSLIASNSYDLKTYIHVWDIQCCRLL